MYMACKKHHQSKISYFAELGIHAYLCSRCIYTTNNNFEFQPDPCDD